MDHSTPGIEAPQVIDDQEDKGDIDSGTGSFCHYDDNTCTEGSMACGKDVSKSRMYAAPEDIKSAC